MTETHEIMTRNAISESSFHSTEALKGHNISNLPTVTFIRKEFVMGVIPSESWGRQ